MAIAFVTGVGGFIGSHLAERLLSMGFRVYGCDNFSTGSLKKIPKGVMFMEEDINAITKKDLNNVDVLFHTAAIARSGWEDEDELWSSNVQGTIRVMKMATEAQVNSVVYSSSCAVLKPTENVYSETKNIAENVAKYYGAVSLRYSNVYGPGQSKEGSYPNVLAAWKKQYEETGKITIHGDGYQQRNFVHVYDVVEANVLAMYQPEQTVNVCWYGGYDLNYVAKNILMLGEDQIVYEGEPRGALSYHQRPTNKLGWKPRYGPASWMIETWNSL